MMVLVVRMMVHVKSEQDGLQKKQRRKSKFSEW